MTAGGTATWESRRLRRRDPVAVLAALPPAQRRAQLAEWMREAGVDDDELRAALAALDPPT